MVPSPNGRSKIKSQLIIIFIVLFQKMGKKPQKSHSIEASSQNQKKFQLQNQQSSTTGGKQSISNEQCAENSKYIRLGKTKNIHKRNNKSQTGETTQKRNRDPLTLEQKKWFFTEVLLYQMTNPIIPLTWNKIKPDRFFQDIAKKFIKNYRVPKKQEILVSKFKSFNLCLRKNYNKKSKDNREDIIRFCLNSLEIYLHEEDVQLVIVSFFEFIKEKEQIKGGYLTFLEQNSFEDELDQEQEPSSCQSYLKQQKENVFTPDANSQKIITKELRVEEEFYNPTSNDYLDIDPLFEN